MDLKEMLSNEITSAINKKQEVFQEIIRLDAKLDALRWALDKVKEVENQNARTAIHQ